MGVSELESTYSFSDLLHLYSAKREKYCKKKKRMSQIIVTTRQKNKYRGEETGSKGSDGSNISLRNVSTSLCMCIP